MIERLFPRQIDAAAGGNLVATLLLVIVAGLKLLMGINATTMTRFVAGTVDGIPLDHYGFQASQAVMAFFSLWGLEQILLASFGLLAALRYRALVPLAYVLLAIEHFGRKGLLSVHSFDSGATASTAGMAINWGLMLLLLIGLLFAFFGKPARVAT